MTHHFPLSEALIEAGEAAYEAAKMTALGEGKSDDEAQVIAADARLAALKEAISGGGDD